MTERIANINMRHHAALAGIEAGIRVSKGIEHAEYHDNLIYPALIQAGVQRFRIVGSMPKQVEESQFLSRKCEKHSDKEYRQLEITVEAALKDHRACSEGGGSETHELFTLASFLTELAFSLQTKSAMVTVFPVPDITKYAGKLTPEMFLAVRGLFQKIDPVDLDLPIPQLKVNSDDIKMFHEIISSDLFSSYAKSHQMLESSEEKKQSTINHILNKAKALHDNFGTVLDLKRLSLSLIPVSTSLIDSVCGKFPGSLANIFGNALTEALKNRRRVTIYNYGETHIKLLMDHYGATSPSMR